jgi:pimeloyl-ACP methyl ester carboxylesterase
MTGGDGIFSQAYRGGSGSPLVALHGFAGTWRVWELVLPALERRHEVLAPTLPGHAGGRPLPAELTVDTLADAVADTMDGAGFEAAHLVGNSLGGYVALQLAARGRARSVVALAPAGGWVRGDPAIDDLLTFQARMQQDAVVGALHADAIASTSAGRRHATGLIVRALRAHPA